MTRLTSIKVNGKDGLKGWTGEEPVAPVQIFAGPNGRGKTTRLLALTAGLRGLADSQADTTRDYIGPDAPNVVVTLGFERDQKRVTLTRILSVTKTTTTEHKVSTERALAIVGPTVSRWDLGDFAASDKARKDILDGVVRAGGAAGAWTAERVREHLMGALEVEEIVKGEPLWHLYDEHDATELSPAEWLAAAIGTATTEGTKANWYTVSNAKRTEAEATARTAAAKLEEEAPTGTLADARLRVSGLEGELREVQTALDVADQSARAVKQRGEREAVLVRALADAQDAKERAELAIQPALVRVRGAEVQVTATFGKAEAATLAATTAHAALPALVAAADDARAAKGEAAKAHAAAEAGVATLARLVESAGGNCRHCDGVDPIGLAEQLATAREAVVPIAEALGDATADAAIAEMHERRGRKAVTDADAVERETGRLHQDALQTLATATNDELAAKDGADRAATATTDAETRLAAHQAEEVAEVGGDLPTLQASRDALVAQLGDSAKPAQDTARWLVERHLTRSADERAHQEAIAGSEKAVDRFMRVKALGIALRELRTRISRDGFRPIEAAALPLLESSGLALVFRSESDFGATVGRDGGAYVSFWSLCDSDRSLVAAATATALATLSGAPWRAVIIDRLEAIDPPRLERFLAGVAGLVEVGQLDNFVGALRADECNACPEVVGVMGRWLGSTEGDLAEVEGVEYEEPDPEPAVKPTWRAAELARLSYPEIRALWQRDCGGAGKVAREVMEEALLARES